MTAVVRDRVGTIRRRWRAWRAGVQRERVALALAALLTFGVGEPLLCIVHCDLWVPGAFADRIAGHQPHHHHAHMASAQEFSGARAAAASAASAAQPNDTGAPCLHGGPSDGSEAPFHVPPSPVHEMLPLALVVLAVASALFAYPAAPPGDPPSVFPPPLLRPPTPFAA